MLSIKVLFPFSNCESLRIMTFDTKEFWEEKILAWENGRYQETGRKRRVLLNEWRIGQAKITEISSFGHGPILSSMRRQAPTS